MNTFQPKKIEKEDIKTIFKDSIKLINKGKYNYIPFIIFIDLLLGVILTSFYNNPVINIIINLVLAPLIVLYFTLHIETIKKIDNTENFSIFNLFFSSWCLFINNMRTLNNYIKYYYIFSSIIFFLSIPLFFSGTDNIYLENSTYIFINRMCTGTNLFFFFCFIFENNKYSHNLIFNTLNIIYNNYTYEQSHIMIKNSSKLNESILSRIKIIICMFLIIIFLSFKIFFPFFVIFCVSLQFSLWNFIFNDKKSKEAKETENAKLDIQDGVLNI